MWTSKTLEPWEIHSPEPRYRAAVGTIWSTARHILNYSTARYFKWFLTTANTLSVVLGQRSWVSGGDDASWRTMIEILLHCITPPSSAPLKRTSINWTKTQQKSQKTGFFTYCYTEQSLLVMHFYSEIPLISRNPLLSSSISVYITFKPFPNHLNPIHSHSSIHKHCQA